MIDFEHFDIRLVIIRIVILVVSIALHEFGHAFSADRLGDPTPRSQGRVTLWPDKHFDPLGFIMIVITSFGLMGFGWGKPVMVNPRYFRHPRRDDIIITICGPLMNLLLAIVFGFMMRFGLQNNWFVNTESLMFQFFYMAVVINLCLMFFNLIPIPPLDGSHILRNLLPSGQAYSYEKFMAQWSTPILLLLFVTGALGYIIGPAVGFALRLIVGPLY